MDMEEIMQKVFAVELLRDKILGYVITEDVERTSGSDIRSCRLVQKSWLESVSRCLRKSRRPLFSINLSTGTSVDGTPYVLRNGKLPEQFMTYVSGPSRLEEHVPPFRLSITPDFLLSKNFQRLKDLLVICGNSLVALDVDFPSDGGTMLFFFPPLSFPNLRQFKVQFNYAPPTGIDADGETPVFGNYNNSAYFMQFILSGSPQLDKYRLESFLPHQRIPSGFDQLTFPRTISELCITTVMGDKDLEVLVKDPLPRLRKLNLLIPYVGFRYGLIFNILEHVRTTLASFTAEEMDHEDQRVRTLFRLPLMEKLKKLELRSIYLELDENLSSLELCLPVLERLVLEEQTVPMISKWITDSTYPTVTSLSVSLADANFSSFGHGYRTNVNVETMPRFRTAFPNLKELDIMFIGRDLCAVQIIFREMKQLEKLRLIFLGVDDVLDSDFFDSLLTGVPVESLMDLRENAELRSRWEAPNQGPPSIRNLTELKTLRIETLANAPDVRNNSLISDLAFNLGFLRMPALQKLVLYGNFDYSSEMKITWEAQQGRSIVDAISDFDWE